MKKKIILIIDTEGKGPLWGRVLFDDNLLIDSGKTVQQIERKMSKLLMDFHQLKQDNFAFEIQHFFVRVDFLKYIFR